MKKQIGLVFPLLAFGILIYFMEPLAAEPMDPLAVDAINAPENLETELTGPLENERIKKEAGPAEFSIIPDEKGPQTPQNSGNVFNDGSGPHINNRILDVIDLKDMDISDVLMLISKKSGLNIVAAKTVRGKVTVYLRNIAVLDALRIIVDAYGWAYVNDEDIVRIMTAEDYIKKYGHHFGETTETRIKRLLYTSPTEVAALLENVKSNTGKIIPEEKSQNLILMDNVGKLQEMEQIIKSVDVPTLTKVFELTYATAEDLSPKITEVLTPSFGRLKTDIRSNRLIVFDTFQKIKEIEDIVNAFDQKDKEVLIEAKILQITLTDENKLGVDWEAIISDFHDLDVKSNFDILSSSDKRGELSIGTIAADKYTAVVQILQTMGVTDVLSTPRIATVNNKEAKILVGSTEPYVTSTTVTSASGPTTTSEAINFIEVGVKLYVTPTIHKDNFITMKIRPEVSSVVNTVQTSSNNSIPVVGSTEAETTVLLKDGTMVIIGGLIEEERRSTVNKIPVLGNIPYLGYVFKNKTERVTKKEIAIFLKATVMTGDVNEDVKTTLKLGTI